MFAVKGIYKKGKIESLHPLEGIEEAELYIIVLPRKSISTNAVIMENGEVHEFKGWTEEEIRKMAMYTLMKDLEESPEVIFDED